MSVTRVSIGPSIETRFCVRTMNRWQPTRPINAEEEKEVAHTTFLCPFAVD